jgi:hypothetical protein
MAVKRKATPAKRAKARRDPAIFQPPPSPTGDRRSAQNFRLTARGRVYDLSDNVEGDTPWSLGMDQAGQVTLPVRDPTGRIVDVLDDESHLQQDGVRCVIDEVTYCITGFDHDGEGLYTLTLEDEVAWRLKQFSRYKSASRARVTRFGFILGFVDEAQRRPLPRLRAFIPEADDKQRIKKPPKPAKAA